MNPWILRLLDGFPRTSSEAANTEFSHMSRAFAFPFNLARSGCEASGEASQGNHVEAAIPPFANTK